MVREGATVGGGGHGPAPAITVLSAVLGCTMAGTLTDKLAVLGHLPVGVRAFAATPPVPLGPYPTGNTAAPLLYFTHPSCVTIGSTIEGKGGSKQLRTCAWQADPGRGFGEGHDKLCERSVSLCSCGNGTACRRSACGCRDAPSPVGASQSPGVQTCGGGYVRRPSAPAVHSGPGIHSDACACSHRNGSCPLSAHRQHAKSACLHHQTTQSRRPLHIACPNSICTHPASISDIKLQLRLLISTPPPSTPTVGGCGDV